MPKLWWMAQISRPFQIVLVAFVLFAVAWFAVIHRPGGESSTGGSASSASSAASATHAGAAHTGAAHAGAATHAAAHASVPARDHARVATPARHARAATPAHAKTVAPAHARTAAPATAAHGRAAAHPSHARGTAHAASHTASSASATAALTLHNLTSALHLSALVKLLDIFDPTASAKVAHAEGVEIARIKAALQPSSQASIAAELKHGKTVLLLFLNPHSYDDDASAIAAVEVAYKLRHDVDAHLALASQVNSYGSITRDIPIYQTPTLLIVNPKRQVTPLTGLTDEFALEQAISEAKAAA